MIPAFAVPALGFVSRHWKALALGAVGLAVAVAFLVLIIQRNDARSERDAALAENAALRGHIIAQNAAIEKLAAEGREAAERAQRALQTAREANRRDASTIEALRRSAGRVRGPNEACTISPELRGATGL